MYVWTRQGLGQTLEQYGLAQCDTGSVGGMAYQRILDTIKCELQRKFSDPNDPRLSEEQGRRVKRELFRRRLRLRELFNGVQPSRAKDLFDQLRRRDDPLAQLFHYRLASAVRDEMLSILGNKISALRDQPSATSTVRSQTPRPQTVQSQPASSLAPVPIDDSLLKAVITSGGGSINTNIWWLPVLRKWDVVTDTSGNKRLVVGFSAPDVLYISRNRGWMQNQNAFLTETVLAPIAEAGRRLEPTRRILDCGGYFTLGVLSATTLIGFFTLNGIELIDFILRHHNDFPRWVDGVNMFLRARKILKQHAPTLYNALMRTAIKEIGQRIPENISANDVCKFIGQLFGLVTGTQIFTATQAARAAAMTVLRAIPPTLAATIRAGHAVIQDIRASAQHIYEVFRRYGIHLALEEAERIVREYAHSEELIKAALTDLTRALEKLQR